MTNDERKILIARFIQIIEGGGASCQYVQKFPYTLCQVIVELPLELPKGVKYVGTGFTKMIPTDEWCSDLGLEIAFGRAINHSIDQWLGWEDTCLLYLSTG